MVLDVAQSLPLHPPICRFQAWVFTPRSTFLNHSWGHTTPCWGQRGAEGRCPGGQWEECFTTSSPTPWPGFLSLCLITLCSRGQALGLDARVGRGR